MTQAMNFTSRSAVQAGRSSSLRSAVPVGRKAFGPSTLSLRTNKVSGLEQFCLHESTCSRCHQSTDLQAVRASKSLQVRAAQSTDEGLDVEQLVKDLQDRVGSCSRWSSSKSSAISEVHW